MRTGFGAGFKAVLIAGVLAVSAAALAAETAPRHGIAMHGEPKYVADFAHLDYVNPEAPKGGTLALAAAGTFDSLNPYVVKGVAAPGLAMVYETLMTNTEDEPFSEYGLIAETVETPDDRSWVAFNLRPSARWHDGRPITADDVVWSFHTLMEKGHPFFRAYYANVTEAKAEGTHRVRFTFGMKGNRELPLILGQMPVLPKHFWAGKDFAAAALDAPLGSGPYKVEKVEAGRRIVYARVKDWWAKDLPVMKGQYNFDEISYDLYRDETVLLQAFFAGGYDFRQENIAKAWHDAYDHPAVQAGRIKKEEIRHGLPAGMQAYVMNARRPLFADARVREALAYAFDFEWSNRQFAHGTYRRTASYFANSDMAATGLPEGHEREILEEFRGQVPEEVFTRAYAPPATAGTGQDMRRQLVAAQKRLSDAGWKLGRSGLLEKEGQPFRFEILINSDSFARWTNPMIANLKKLGIDARLRLVDAAQYQNRTDSFDFDMTVATFPQSLSPGNEQRDFWGSEKADAKGSRNLIGVKNPVVDKLIGMIVAAPDREELVARARALDRVLLWNHYVIPQWHIDYYRAAWWDKFGRPGVTPRYGLPVAETWWVDPEKAAALKADAKAPPPKSP